MRPCSRGTSPDRSPDSSGGTPRESPRESRPGRPLLLTVKEAAVLIGVGRTTLYKLMDTGDIVSVRVGSSRRIPLTSVYEFVDRLCPSAEPTRMQGS
jgi:excisionase family DNA binding protein